MNRSKIIIVALALAAIALVAFVFFVNPMLNDTRQSSGRYASAAPRVAIITQQTLTMIATTERPPAETSKDSQTDSSTKTVDTAETKVQTAEVAKKLLVAALDFMSAQIADEMTRTGRVEIVDPLRVSQVVDDLDRSAQSDKEARGGSGPSFIDYLSGKAALPDSPDPAKTESGTKVEVSGAARGEDRRLSQSKSLYQANVSKAAELLEAKYLLVVYVAEPQYEDIIQPIPNTNRHVHVIRAVPAFSYRFIDGASGTALLSRVRSPERPIEVIYTHESGTPENAFRQAQQELQVEIARGIVADILATVFPAQISSVEGALTIDRGARDGVEVGDVFEVSRALGAVVGGGDVVLAERVLEPVGSVRVTRVQETLSIVTPVSGEKFEMGDLVSFDAVDYASRAAAKAGAQNAAAAPQGEEAPALGARMQAERKSDIVKPRLAVRDVKIDYVDCAKCREFDSGGAMLAEALETRLQNEPRVEVVSVQDVAAAITARSYADNASGASIRGDLRGMSADQYFITGSVTVTQKTIVKKERIAGVERETGRSTSLSVNGQFRAIEAEKNLQREAVSIAFTTPGSATQAGLRALADRIAAEATTELLRNLYPLAVLERVSDTQIVISGGEQAGLKIGSRLQVYSMGPAVQDLYSDAASQTRAKSGVIVVHDVQRDRAIARFEGSAFAISRGDQLQVLAGRAAAPGAAAQKPASAPQAAVDADRF